MQKGAIIVALKKKLSHTAKENATVSKGTSKEQITVKAGVPNDHSKKHLSEAPVVGASIGTTLNMGDYQSLRVDVWLTDNVQNEESVEQAYGRVVSVLNKTLQDIVSQYKDY